MDGVGGKRGWAWIFILEGLLTVVVSIIAYNFVPTWPEDATFLTTEEKVRLLQRLKYDSAGATEKFEWKYVKQALTDHLVWGYAMLFHGFSFVLYSLSLFLPTIIAGLGFSTWRAQLLTVPPYALSALSIGVTAWLSAKYEKRAIFIIIAGGVGILGYILLLVTNTAGAQYVGVHLACMGVYTGNALLLSWPSENVASQTKRATAVAIQISIGDLGAIAGVLIYRPEWNAHRFRKPHIISIGYLLFGVAVAVYLWAWMARDNRRKELILKERDINSNEKVDGVAEAKARVREGDRHIQWRYQT